MWRPFILVLVAAVHKGNSQGSNQAGACQPGWVQVGSSCLYFRESFPATYAQAEAECINMAATLLRFSSGSDVTAFAAVARARQGVDGWWTDLTQVGHVGIWTWGQNEEVFNDEMVWNQEPDDVKHAENCLALNYLGKFSDDMCSRRHGVICEKPNPPGQPGCDDGWIGTQTSCYYTSDTTDPYEMLSWTDAGTYCSNKGATLVSIETTDELSFITTLLGASYTIEHRWWTGINDMQSEGNYVNPNKQPVASAVLQWETMPNNLSSVEQCALVHSNGHLSHQHCDQPYPYICKLDASAQSVLIQQQLGCAGLWTRAGRKCYFFRPNGTVSHDDARSFCQQQGADLLKVETLDEKHWLTLQMSRTRGGNFWTGLRRSSHGASDWVWADGAKSDASLVQWNSEPNDFAGNEDCAAIGQDGVYNDLNCLSRAAFICQFNSETMACPTGWVTPGPDSSMDGSTCFYFSNTSDAWLATFWEARDKCVQLAGNNPAAYLLGVTSQDVAQFVQTQLAQQPKTAAVWWTDLTDVAIEGVWQFYDTFLGQVNPDIIQWNSEPNNYLGNEDCTVVYYAGRFNDMNCAAKANVACEKHAGAGVRLGGPATSALVVVSIFVSWFLQ